MRRRFFGEAEADITHDIEKEAYPHSMVEVAHTAAALTTARSKQGSAHAFEGGFCLNPIRAPLDGLELSENRPGERGIPCRQSGN
jgi:hypothetical protein